jgi:hypothetical protein
MRKILSILLLAMLGLPLASPLIALGQDADARLPICCREHGRHACKAHQVEREGLQQLGTVVSVRPERCPYCPASVMTARTGVVAVSGAGVVYAGLLSHAAGLAQTESKRRMARDRSRQKRGPPKDLS